MKKTLTIFFLIVMSYIGINAMEEKNSCNIGFFKKILIHVHSLFWKPLPKELPDNPDNKKPLPKELPKDTRIFDNFALQRDKNRDAYYISDIKEFDNEYRYPCHLEEQYNILQKQSVENEKWPTNKKNYALLEYARIMIQHEEEWNSWYTAHLMTEGKGIKPHEYTASITSKSIEKPVIIRQYFKSPYYRSIFFSEIIKTNEKKRIKFYELNALENTAYHDELQFLETQLHKMDLYWSMKTSRYQKLHNDSFQEQRKLLNNEIELFKTDINRPIFTKSCMRNKHFTIIQESRNAYTQSQKE